MKDTHALLGYAELIHITDHFIQKNTTIILGLGLAAGIGRFFQEGGNGEVSATTHSIIETIVTAARFLTILVVIGKGHIRSGLQRLVSLFRLTKTEWQSIWANILNNFSANFLAILINFLIYAIIAAAINIGLFALFGYTPFLEWLKLHEVISPAASKWPVLLLLKNITIIPFTFVFEVLLAIWIVKRNKTVNQ